MSLKMRIVVVVTFAFLVSIGIDHPAFAVGPGPAEARNVALIGHLDIEGGGMVDVHEGIAYIGHMRPPFATSIVDVSDPAKPEILSRIRARPGTHSHKARVCGNTMITNCEQYSGSIIGYVFNTLIKKADKVGLAVFDVSNPADPAEIAFMEVGGVNLNNAPAGVHRFEFDCERKFAYISATAEGYRGNIVRIIDLSDPGNLREVARWWLPGQWVAGGEKPMWKRNDYRVHHPNRLGDRLYVPLWYGGFAIVDLSDITDPETVSHVNLHHQSPIHTTLPVDHQIMGRNWLLVFDEDISDECEDTQASMWVFDITNEKKPVSAASFQVPEGGKHSYCDGQKGKRFGAHQPHEYVGEDNLVYAAWFAGGLRVIDISNPYEPEGVGHYVPEPVGDHRFPQSNDVFVDDNGLIYLIDRNNGLDILRFVGERAKRREKRDEEARASE
ncbi:MAG: hypothetical protein JSV16_14310 [Candidatus Hydrogenedentota bacterium]|nr:MAG: hypothetical protein JSV16_14310 [Candidatus Hydrogenedentota bacterium]